MKITTEGLIIREQNIGEQDKLITVLSKDLGVIRGFVRGAKNLKSSKSAATGLLCYSRLSVFVAKDSYIFDDAQLIEMFFELRRDVEKVALAQYFCELSMHICPEGQQSSEQLSTVLNALFLLTKGDRSNTLIKSAVELRLASLSGYMPDLVMCHGCGKYEDDEMYFTLPSGKLSCKNCYIKSPLPSSVQIDRSILNALRHIIYSEPRRIFAFSLPSEALDELNYITENYICRVLERDLVTLHFYKTIKG